MSNGNQISTAKTLKVHRHRKKQIQEEHIYNNHPSSVIWYKARINALQLNDRTNFLNFSNHITTIKKKFSIC